MSESEKIVEVWKWKDEVYEKTKQMTKEERIKFFNAGLEDFVKKTGLKLAVKKHDHSRTVL